MLRAFIKTLLPCSALVLWGVAALALPATKSVNDTVDDAKITLTILDKVLLDDSKSWCSVRIEITEDDVKFTEGDVVTIWVYEDDLAGDENVWNTRFTILPTDVGKKFDQTFDCSSAFGDDTGDEAEFYAEAEVVKDECGIGCSYDRPETGLITVPEVSDDSRENDDSTGTAKPAALGTIADLISRDDDWFSFEITALSKVTFLATHTPLAGRLDVVMQNGAGGSVGTALEAGTYTSSTANALVAGSYLVKVFPRDAANPNFYDATLTVEPVPLQCDDGDTETQPCPPAPAPFQCGTQVRTCNAQGEWGAWGSCENEGVCSPAAQKSEACGNCGTRTSTCSDNCVWEPGPCAGEGACADGATDTEACPSGGTRTRTCTAACAWGEWSACTGDGCTEAATRDCYTGAEATRKIGACQDGQSTCTSGAWGACVGEVTPVAEICADDADNDCDGDIDAQDSDCAGGADLLGEDCAGSTDCGAAWECVSAPSDPMFVSGYCGRIGCINVSDCGTNGTCGYVFGENYCLRKCTIATDCRTGYLCATVGAAKACVPRCTQASHCRDAATPVCDMMSGLCVASSSALDVPGQTDTGMPDAGEDEGGSGGGCSAGSQNTPMGWLLGLLACVALRVRRSRHTA